MVRRENKASHKWKISRLTIFFLANGPTSAVIFSRVNTRIGRVSRLIRFGVRRNFEGRDFLMPNSDENRSIRVLLVSPQPTLAGQIKTAERNGRVVDVIGEAPNVDLALGVIATKKPDVILLDEEIGETSSIGRLSELVAASPVSKILVLAEHKGDGISERALVDGAHGLVDRSSSVETLMTVVRKMHDGEMWFNRKLTSKILSRADIRNCHTASEPNSIDKLTKREREITQLIGAGLANKEIAARLGLSEKTVRNHLSTIYSKMGVPNRLGLALLVSKNTSF